MTEQFANNASSTLNGAINNVTTTIVVTSAASFPSIGNFRLLIGVNPLTAEIVLVTGVSGNTFTVVRGQEATAANSWADLTTVTHIVTAGAIEALRANLRKDKSLHSSLDTINSSQDGYALTWLNSDGYWAARPGSPFTIVGNELYTTKTLSIDPNATVASSHNDGYSKLYINGNVLATKYLAGETPLVTMGFGYVSDATQSFVVPSGITSIRVKVWGPGGGTASYSASGGGGPGGYSTGYLSVTPGETLWFVVGSGGKKAVSTTGNGGNGGWPGGGFGTRGDASGGGGGGCSAIFSANVITQANALIVAGGGGGSTGFGNYGAGGGGGLTAGSGTSLSGKGATQSAGGTDGNSNPATSTTIASGSNGASLPQATINVASTTTFPSTGTLLVTTSGGIQIVGYTGKNATQFTGCTGGTGTMSTGGAVVYAVAGSAFTGGIAFANQTTSQTLDNGGGGSGYFGGGAGQGDGQAGGGGSGFLHATRITSGTTTTGANANSGNAQTLPPNTTDPNYIAGIGVGAATGLTGVGNNGGDGYIVLQWGGLLSFDLDSIDFANSASISTIGNDINFTTVSPGKITLQPLGDLLLTSTTTSTLSSPNTTVSSTATTTISGTTDVRFNTAATLRGYFDSSGFLRIGPSASIAASGFGVASLFPQTSTDYLYMYNASGSAWGEIISGGTINRSAIQILNTGAGTSSTVGVSLFAGGTSHSTAEYAGNGIIEQAGASTSALVFTKMSGAGVFGGSTGAIWQSGSWSVGRATNNDTSSEAQAGLTGPLINLSSNTGTFTTVANQSIIFNQSGALNLQGNTEVRFNTGSSLKGYFDSNGVFRTGPSASTSASGFGISWPAAATDTVFVHNASGNSYYTNWSGSSTGVGGFLAYNTSAGASATIGIATGGAGTSHATTAIAGNGFIEQAGAATSALVFRKIVGNNTSPGTTGRIYQSGAWVLGENVINDTSAEAQAGLTGSLLNISPITGGTLTTTANQSLLYNDAGTVTLQGNIGHSLIAGTTTVASTSTSKFITNVGRRIATNIKTANYTITTSDEVIIVGALSGSITITLPAAPTAGDKYTIKDQGGTAASFNIIVSGNGANIDGTASYTINTNYEGMTVIFANGTWSII